MQAKHLNGILSLGIVFGLLWCAILVVEVPADPRLRFLGVVLIAIGLAWGVFSRWIASSTLRQASRFPHRFGTNFWDSLGEARLGLFYRVIGVGLVVSGSTLVLKTTSIFQLASAP